MKNRRLWVSIVAGILALVMVLTLVLSLLPTRAYAKTRGRSCGPARSRTRTRLPMWWSRRTPSISRSACSTLRS